MFGFGRRSASNTSTASTASTVSAASSPTFRSMNAAASGLSTPSSSAINAKEIRRDWKESAALKKKKGLTWVYIEGIGFGHIEEAEDESANATPTTSSSPASPSKPRDSPVKDDRSSSVSDNVPVRLHGWSGVCYVAPNGLHLTIDIAVRTFAKQCDVKSFILRNVPLNESFMHAVVQKVVEQYASQNNPTDKSSSNSTLSVPVAPPPPILPNPFSSSTTATNTTSNTSSTTAVNTSSGFHVRFDEVRLVSNGVELNCKDEDSVVAEIGLRPETVHTRTRTVKSSASYSLGSNTPAQNPNTPSSPFQRKHSPALPPAPSPFSLTSSTPAAAGSSSALPPMFSLLFIHDEISKFSLDRNRCGADIMIADDGLAAHMQCSDARWSTVRGSRNFQRGKHYWKVSVTACNSGNLFVGVTDSEDVKTANYLGHDEHGYGFYGCGNVYRSGHSKPYGTSYRTGDVITIRLDMDALTLSFMKNDDACGVAFESLPSPVWPAFSLYNRGDSFTLLEFGTYS